jgi:adenosylhomocysteine nucleosidase
MERPRVLILTAVMIEANAVAAALGADCPAPGRPTVATRDGLSIELHVIGIAGKGLAEVRPQESPTVVIMAGLAGGLDPSLKIGDVVIDGGAGDLIAMPDCRRGRIHTTRRVVSAPQDKADLFRTTGASAVDMENDIVREWARGRGAEFIAIRAISDRADQSLDATLLRIVDEWGRPRVPALVRALLSRPSLLTQLLRLGSDSKKAARWLGTAVQEWVLVASRQASGGAIGVRAGEDG